MSRGRTATELAETLGHRFDRPDLLIQALTHMSAAVRDKDGLSYERLEFLGDRVLGLALAETLYLRFPAESEGDIAKRLAQLARREALVTVASKLELGDYVRMSAGEAGAGSRESRAILADCCEAVIGALYLDGGLEVAKRFVLRAWEPLIEAQDHPPSDSKTALQEWAQGQGHGLPRYRQVRREGPPHRPVFTVEVVVVGMDPVEGTGNSKRGAEQAAARALLDIVAAAAPG